MRFFDKAVPTHSFTDETVSFWVTVILPLLPYMLKLCQRFIFTIWGCQGSVFNNQSCVSMSSMESRRGRSCSW